MIPQLARLLSPEEVQRIHEASLEILDQVGLEVNNPRARERFREHGCRVDDATERVTFPPAVIEECLKSIPPKFTFYAQDPEFDRVVFNEAVGEVHGPVQTQFGYHLLEVTSRDD